MRPRNLDEFVGQEHLVGERGPLRRSIARGHLSSLLLWGPPGTGKTSLARLLAAEIGAEFATMSAVMAGVADVRGAIAESQERLALHGQRTILFLDEIHRFNKAQQDALLPHVEDGTVTLIGATTENPYFEVNAALLSRMRVWRLEQLTDEDVATVVRRAIADEERGLAGGLGPDGGVDVADEAFDHLVSLAGGDARAALNVLEGAVALAEAEGVRDKKGRVAPRLEDVEAAAQQRILGYDRAGDGHYDTVSAFIKSLRGNDPDAALYWLATMIAAGEDPKFIARRLIIAASEDVGNADPRALTVAVSAAQALDWVGLPEAQYALAQAATYIATAPKSNRSGSAYWAAVSDVDERGSLPVPLHLRQAPYARHEAARDRRRVSLQPRIRRRRRRAAVPARRAGRAPLLPANRPGLRGDDRRADGRPGRGAGRRQGRRTDPEGPLPHPAGQAARRQEPHGHARDEPQEAGRNREDATRPVDRRPLRSRQVLTGRPRRIGP